MRNITHSIKKYVFNINSAITWFFLPHYFQETSKRVQNNDVFCCVNYVLTSPQEFENGGFTLKTHQMFFLVTHYTEGV